MSDSGFSWRLRALPWLFCFQFFVAEQVARVHVQGPYSFARNAISDLGALRCFGTGGTITGCSPLHPLMNASFTLQGLLIVSGALSARRFFADGLPARLAFLSFALSGIGVLVVGLAPEDAVPKLHVLAASAHFLGGSLAMVLLGLSLLRNSRRVGVLSIAAGTLALAATLLLGLRDAAVWTQFGLRLGLVERVAAYPLPLWLTLTGLVLLTQGRADELRTNPAANGSLPSA